MSDLCNQPFYPNIQLWAFILLSLKDLWSSIGRAATPCGQRLPGLEKVAKSKICKRRNIRAVSRLKIVSDI